jgi:tetratricopeptide (TPR) repeat protein
LELRKRSPQRSAASVLRATARRADRPPQLDRGAVDAAARTWSGFREPFPASPSTVGWSVVAAKYGIDSAAAECRAALRSDILQWRVAAHGCVSAVELTHGRVTSSLIEVRREVDTDSARGAARTFADFIYRWNDADYRALFLGRKAEAAEIIDALVPTIALANLPASMQSAPVSVIEAYAFDDRADRARAYFDKWTASLDTAGRRLRVSDIHASLGRIAVAEKKYDIAVREFLAADTLYDGQPTPCPTCFEPELGHAYDLAGKQDEAIATFEKYLATPYATRWMGTDPLYLGGIYKRLGELYEEKNDDAKAAQYYAKFIALWKNADPELQPAVADAKARLGLVLARDARKR